MQTAGHRRLQRAKAAHVLLALHANDNLQDPAFWNWNTLNRLPEWCLAGEDERVQLQLACGAIYLSAEMRFWISQSAVKSVQSLLGASMFDCIVSRADAMQLPREPVAAVVAQFGVDPNESNLAQIQSLLMAAGSDVLRATLHESLPQAMLANSLGPGCHSDISIEAAQVLHDVARAVVQEPHLNTSPIASSA